MMAAAEMIPNQQLVDMLLKCRNRFDYYAGNHRDKASHLANNGLEQNRALVDATLTKAASNEAMVAEIDALLGVESVRSSDNKSTTACDVIKTMKLPPIAEMSVAKDADHMSQVIAFHDIYRVETAALGSKDPVFAHMTDERAAMRVGLIQEEFLELLKDGFGISAELTLHHLSGRGYVDGTAGNLAALMRTTAHRNGAEIADALGDIVYVCYGFALELGYDLRDVIREIHAANLTKLGDDGKPIMRADGKVLKGPSYHAPNIPAALGWTQEAS